MPRVRFVAQLALGALVTAVVAAAGARPARAQTLDLPGGGTPSTVARAGTGVVAADDAAALWLNPAGMARRSAWRAQLGFTWVARSARFDSDEAWDAPPAQARQLAGPEVAPSLALEGHLGDRVVVGLAWLEPTHQVYAWPAPDPYHLPPTGQPADGPRYPVRYAATDFELRRRGGAVGASLRALPWLAVGASAWLVHVEAVQSLSLWGGQGPITSLPNLSTAFDLRFAASADGWSAGGVVGALVAPLDTPIELGLSVAFGGDASLAGTPALSDSRGTSETTGSRYVTATITDDARATLELPTPVVARGGVRFVGERLSLEAGGAVAHGGAATPVWRLEGVSMAFEDVASGSVEAVPLGVSLRDGWSLNAAFDADVVPGFLTVSAGWAYARGAVARATLSPSLPALDSHTVSLGATVRVEGYTVVLGVAYAPAAAVDLQPGGAQVVAPLAEGAPPAARGTLDASSTLVGVSVEAEL